MDNFIKTSASCDTKNTKDIIYDRFFIVKLKSGSFQKVSPFVINKAIRSTIGNVVNIKKLRSGDLLIEVAGATQAILLSKCTELGEMEVSIQAHNKLNSCRGVISESEFLYCSEEELLENLKQHNVSNVKRINIRRDGNLTPTKHLILTFNTPTLPQYISMAYIRCSVRPYIPNPLRCFQCQRYGHSKASCRGTLTCSRCATGGHEGDSCSASPKCFNCKGDHPAYSRSCPKWAIEKEIQTIKIKNNISFPEARKLVESRTPKPGISYSSVLAKSMTSVATQTDFPALSTSIVSNVPSSKQVIPSQPVKLKHRPEFKKNNKSHSSTRKSVTPKETSLFTKQSLLEINKQVSSPQNSSSEHRQDMEFEINDPLIQKSENTKQKTLKYKKPQNAEITNLPVNNSTKKQKEPPRLLTMDEALEYFAQMRVLRREASQCSAFGSSGTNISPLPEDT